MLSDIKHIKHRLVNWLAGVQNPQAKSIKRILDQEIDYSRFEDPDTVRDCDLLYVDRWQVFRRAYSHSFWESHFDLDNLINSGVLDEGPILDFACGTGNIDIELAHRGHRVVGIDLSPKAIAIANVYREGMPSQTQERVRFEQADVNTYQPTERFTICITTQVLEHIEDPEFVFAALRRLLVEGGRVWVSVPFGDHFDHYSHVHHFYTNDELAAFLGRYAKVEQVRHDTVHHVLSALLRI